MKAYKKLMAILLGLSSLGVSAQNAQTFVPHWEMQLGIGGQYTLGEVSFDELLSPNVQIGAGYWFTPSLGVRGTVNAWQSKAGIDYANVKETWKWNYVAPQIDATFNLTNLIFGTDLSRAFDWTAFGGIGANIAFNNSDATEVMNYMFSEGGPCSTMSEAHKKQNMDNVWTGTKGFLVFGFGTGFDYKLSERLALGVEMQANTLQDSYNSKDASNSDWYFNALASVKYSFGGKSKNAKTYAPVPVPVSAGSSTSSSSACESCEPCEPETITVEKQVVSEVKSPTFVRNVLFIINMDIKKSELKKIDEIAKYMKENPDTKVKVVGYCDVKTGSYEYNQKLAVKRVDFVSEKLQNAGIDKSRITTDPVGVNEQPFGVDEYFKLNRVVICTVQ